MQCIPGFKGITISSGRGGEGMCMCLTLNVLGVTARPESEESDPDSCGDSMPSCTSSRRVSLGPKTYVYRARKSAKQRLFGLLSEVMGHYCTYYWGPGI